MSDNGMAKITQRQRQQSMLNNSEGQQLYAKWQGIFNNANLCMKYDSPFSKYDITVPVDPTERTIAQQAAQDKINEYNSNPNKYAGNDDESNNMYAVCARAAKKFLRKCTAYTNKYALDQNKQVSKMMKQNPSIGAYTQDQIIPIDDKPVSIKNAAISAGKEAAFYEKQYISTNDEEIKKQADNLEQSIGKWLGNKMYNTYFYYTYLTSIADEKPGEEGTKRGFVSNDEETMRRNKLSALTVNYNNYENNLMRDIGQFSNTNEALNQVNSSKQQRAGIQNNSLFGGR